MVICPALLKFNWRVEVLNILGLNAYVCEGQKPTKRISEHYDVVICNYDILPYWLKVLDRFDPELIAVDEAQYCRNPTSRRTRMVQQLTFDRDKLVMMTGTPVTNRPSELWPLLNMLWPHKFPNYAGFGFKYCRATSVRGRIRFGEARMTKLPSLHKKLKKLGMIRRLKKDVLKDLPEKIITTVPLELTTKGMMEYIHAESDFLGWLKTVSPKKAARSQTAVALTRIGYLKRLAATLKVQLCLEWVDTFLDQDEGKIVLFSLHKKIIAEVEKRYKDISVKIDGSVSSKRREAAVATFQQNDKYRVFNGQTSACGVGITLTRASTAALLEMAWTPADNNQAIDRIHRIGQKETAFVYYLIAVDTIEEDLCAVLDVKQKVSNLIVDGGRADNIDMLERLLEATLQRSARRKKRKGHK